MSAHTMEAAHTGAAERVWVDRIGVVDRVQDPARRAAAAARQAAAFEWTTAQYKLNYHAPLAKCFHPSHHLAAAEQPPMTPR